MDTVLRTQMLYDDQLADKFGREEELIWGECTIDLQEVVAFSQMMLDNEVIKDATEILFRSGSARAIRVPYYAFREIMNKVMGKPLSWEELMKNK